MQDLETRYAMAADGAYVAYQTSGTGPIDVVWQPDWPGNIDMEWEFPVLQSFLGGIASFARLIRHDHRGVGLSSRNVPIPEPGDARIGPSHGPGRRQRAEPGARGHGSLRGGPCVARGDAA